MKPNQPEIETDMNTLTKWSPFRTPRWDPIQQQLADFERGLERFFGRSPQASGNGDEQISAAAWEPLTDITEDEKEYLVKAELPEVKKEDVKVTVEEDENGRRTVLTRLVNSSFCGGMWYVR